MNQTIPAIFGGPPGVWELAIVGVIALLIFGRRLPDVARSVGKSIVEFKKGMREVKDDLDTQTRIESPPQGKLEQKPAPPAAASTSPAAVPAETTATSAEPKQTDTAEGSRSPSSEESATPK